MGFNMISHECKPVVRTYRQRATLKGLNMMLDTIVDRAIAATKGLGRHRLRQLLELLSHAHCGLRLNLIKLYP